MMFRTAHIRDIDTWQGESLVPLFNPNASIGRAILDALDRDPCKVAQVK